MPTWIYTIGIYAAIFGGGYWYYTSTQETILNLNIDNAAYKSANVQMVATIQQLSVDAEETAAAQQQLQSDRDEAEKYGRTLEKKLQKHNLTRLAIAKPGLIENIINDATKEKLESLESLTRKQPSN